MSWPWNNPAASARSITGRNDTDSVTLRPPESPEDWVGEYERRRATMYGEPYTIGEQIAYAIFRAEDTGTTNYSPQSVALREEDAIRFVQQVNASGLFRSGAQLEAAQDTDTDTAPGEEVWLRSSLARVATWWARLLSGMGEIGLEAVLMDDGAHIVAYDPEQVVAEYDVQTGTRLTKVTLLAPYLDPDDLDEFGRVTQPTRAHTYKREITDARIDVWIDGVHQEDKSGPHGLGVVPFAWLTWDAMPGDPVHGVPSSHGMEARVARLDSIAAQIDAVGKRYANPVPWLAGGVLEDNNPLQLGKFMHGLNKDATLAYLEPTMSGISVLGQESDRKRKALQDSRPEFIFHGAGASASGEALKVRSAQYVGKVEEVRGTVFAALAYLTACAVALDTKSKPALNAYTVQAPPVLPVDSAAAVDSLVKAKSLGLLTREVASALQRLGYIDAKADVERYAKEMEDAESLRARVFFQDDGGTA